MIRISLLLLAGTIIASCDTAKNSLTLTAADLPTTGRPLGRLDIITMIDPENRRKRLKNDFCQTRAAAKNNPQDFAATDLQCAMAAFETYFMTNIEFRYYIDNLASYDGAAPGGVMSDESNPAKKETPAFTNKSQVLVGKNGLPKGLIDDFQKKKARSYALALKRTEIQDAVMRHSDEYCRIFQEDVADNRALFQMGVAGTSTLLGGLGAIFTNANVARALAGAAGITTGIGAEFESAFFQRQALSTIYAGIALRRQRIGQAIHDRRYRTIDPEQNRKELMKKHKPIEEVFGFFMRNGEIRETEFKFSEAQLAQFAEDENYLLVVNYQDQPPQGEETGADDGADGGDAQDNPAPSGDKKDTEEIKDPPEEGKEGDAPTSIPPRSSNPVALVSVASYTLERAIGDALVYHQACTLTEGLLEAENSIDSYSTITQSSGVEVGKDYIEEIFEQRSALQSGATGAPAK